uniref:Suppression of tumorigenicity 5 protein n=2 Tax=Lygus hesperus TaxID=30085 RepID=A0A146L393_LYGHE
MERKRVFEIKKRFEELDKNKAVTNGNAASHLSTHSHKINNGIDQPCRSEALHQADLTEKNIVFKRTHSSSSSVEGQSSGRIKRSPAFRSSKNDFCAGKVKTGCSQSKDVKESPLPKGPAPRKPPRTFVHRVGGEVGDMPSLPSCSAVDSKMTDSDEKNNNKPTFKRSKTEPLIMLNKIETALKVHQAGMRMKEKPPAPPTNGNIYDEPHDDQRRESIPEQFRSRHAPFTTIKSLRSPVQSPEPVYSEPCIIKSKSQSPPGPKSSKSLYYMSSPIVDGDGNPRLPRNPTYEEALKKIQMWVLTDEPSAPPAELDSDPESVKEIKPEVVEERKHYARRISSLRERSVSLREVRTQRLMDALLLVGIDSDLDNGKVAYIKSKYPYNAEIPENIACLIFPDAENWPPAVHPPLHIESSNANNYTIVLTSAEGSRSYAYCRRLQPEGSTVCLPLAYAILTPHKATSFYYKVLEEIENNHGMSEQNFKGFVRDLYNTDFPNECQSIRVGDIMLKRRMDSRQDGNEISKLLKAINIPNFIQLLSHVLLERKIILVSSYISSLSDSIQGLLKSIYPFDWPHTLVTVVPSIMFEILQSPIPYVLGIMKNEKAPLPVSFFTNIEDVFVIDLDKGQILANTNPSDGPVLPDKLSKSLKMALYNTPVNCTDVRPSEALMGLFVRLVGHYRNHIVSQMDYYPHHMRVFQRDNFITAPSSKGIRQFLEWFTEMPMFQVFIEEKKARKSNIEGLLFEQRCAEYVEENAKNLNKKGTTLNKAVKNLGDRIKDWRS